MSTYGGQRWKRRRLALGGATVAVHALVLTWLATAPHTPPRTLPAPSSDILLLDIAPRPLLRGERRRETLTPAETQDAVAPAPDAVVRRRDEEDESLAPSAAAPPSAPAAPSADVAPGGFPFRPELRRGARRGAIACARFYDQLTPEEQALCDARDALRAERPRTEMGSGDPARDARFARESARRLAEYEGRRAPLSGGTGVVPPADCPGSNFGTGCAGSHLPDVPGVDMRQGGRTTHTPSQKR